MQCVHRAVQCNWSHLIVEAHSKVQQTVMQVWWSRAATVGLHAALGAALYRRARATDLTSSAAIARCYMFIWKLFYAEYLLIPLLR